MNRGLLRMFQGGVERIYASPVTKFVFISLYIFAGRYKFHVVSPNIHTGIRRQFKIATALGVLSGGNGYDAFRTLVGRKCISSVYQYAWIEATYV